MNARANIAIVDATVNEWNSQFKAAAQFYAQAADLIAKTYVIHMKQYARPDRLLRMVEMRRKSALAYERSGDATDARMQISDALQFLSGYSHELDQAAFDDTLRQLQKDNEAIKGKS
jgi:hypothetical protein